MSHPLDPRVLAARFKGLLLVLALAAGWALLELLGAWATLHPLDPPLLPRAVVGTAAVLVLLGEVGRRLLPRSPLVGMTLGLSLPALVWLPESLRELGVLRPDLPGVGLALVLLLAAVWRPRVALGLVMVGALARPAARALHGPTAGADRRLSGWTDHGGMGDASAADGPGQRPEGLHDILLLTVDTVRADAALLDRPEAGWQRYEQAVAASPWTLPSMLSLMSGLPVREHGGGLPLDDAPGFTRVVDDTPWLPELLQGEGYRTAAVISNPHLRASEGFTRGFDLVLHHDDAREPHVLLHALDALRLRTSGRVPRVARTRDARVEAASRRLLAAEPGGAPRLLWVHLLGPHEYARDVALPPAGWKPGVDDPQVLRAAYAVNVAAAAERVRRLAGQAPDWTVAVTSDHGEELGEAGRFGHGHALDDRLLHVPLLIRWAPSSGRTGTILHAEQVASFELLSALWQGTGPPYRRFVEVGGVRADGERFARRSDPGDYTARPAGRRGEGSAWEQDRMDALEALGYVEND